VKPEVNLKSKVDSGLTRKVQTRLERLVRDKHSSLDNEKGKGYIPLTSGLTVRSKMNIYSRTGPNVIRIFTAVIYGCS
jgi:hypothetical protein